MDIKFYILGFKQRMCGYGDPCRNFQSPLTVRV